MAILFGFLALLIVKKTEFIPHWKWSHLEQILKVLNCYFVIDRNQNKKREHFNFSTES